MDGTVGFSFLTVLYFAMYGCPIVGVNNSFNFFYMTKELIDLCAQFNVPLKNNVEYNRIYAFDAFEVPVLEIFTRYLNNRGGREDAMEKHVREIKDAIVKEGNMDKIPPIIVDVNTNQIVDGNCRFKALQYVLEEGTVEHPILRVIYEDVPQNEFDDRVIQFNMGQQSWKLIDFIYNYSLRGYDSFTKLIDFCNRNETLHDGSKINPRYGAAALNIPPNDLKKNTLNITDEIVEIGNHVVFEAAEIRKQFSTDLKANGGGWYEPYLRAWAEFRSCLGDITFKDYLREVRRTVQTRKRDVQVPYGSNKKSDWNGFFRTVKTYIE